MKADIRMTEYTSEANEWIGIHLLPLCIFFLLCCLSKLSKLLNVFVQIAKFICPECWMYLSKLQNVFVQITKVTVQIHLLPLLHMFPPLQMVLEEKYLSKFSNFCLVQFRGNLFFLLWFTLFPEITTLWYFNSVYQKHLYLTNDTGAIRKGKNCSHQ